MPVWGLVGIDVLLGVACGILGYWLRPARRLSFWDWVTFVVMAAWIVELAVTSGADMLILLGIIPIGLAAMRSGTWLRSRRDETVSH